MLDIENNVKSVDDKVGDLKPNIEIIDGDSLTITI
jgi:hypothetical protein